MTNRRLTDMKEEGKCAADTVIDMERIQKIFEERDTVYPVSYTHLTLPTTERV